MDALLDAAPLVTTSLTGRSWSLRAADESAAQTIARDHDIPQLLARLLLARGIEPEQVANFLSPSLRHSLPDPSHLKDMDHAAQRLAGAVSAGETIAIFGDYDVDGATASALLRLYFREAGKEPLVYIPDRITEGYGPNEAALMQLKDRGASVIITVDCGSLSFAPLEAAFEAGLDVIVVDHHQAEAKLPRAYAVINPNRMDETSPHRHLAAVGVAFLLLVAVHRTLRANGWFATRQEPDLLSLLDLVALGTVCDVVSLTGLNRALAAQGFKVLAGRGNLGLRTLMDIARLDEKPGAYACGFVLGPRINAGGRVGKADYGSRLLATEDAEEAHTLACALDVYNEERKAIEALVLEEAFAQAAAQLDEPVLVVSAKNWHPGVIGIVAGRLKERFGRPVAVIAMDGESGKASARSVPGFDFGAQVIAARDCGLLLAGGGHAMAAGFSVEAKHLPALQAFFCKRMPAAMEVRATPVDAVVALSGLNVELAHLLERAAPFGQGNPAPRIAVQNVKIAAVEVVKEQHLRLILTDEGKTRMAAMAFRSVGTPFGAGLQKLAGKKAHVLGTLKLRTWQGREEAGFTVDDAAAA